MKSMDKKRERSPTGKLRRDAERRLAKQPAGTVAAASQADSQRLLHELQVHQLEQELAEHARRVRELSHRLVGLQEEERRGIAEELHARTSPNFAAIKFNLETILANLPETVSLDVQSRIEDSMALLEDAVASIRETGAALRPPLLDYAGLGPALEEYARQLENRTGIAIQCACAESKTRLAKDLELGLFRIAQEALTNSAKHAGAKAVTIELAQLEDRCTLTIADDGIGFDSIRLAERGYEPGLGLLTMRERAEFMGATFSLESQPGRGTRIKVTIDVNR